MGHEVDSDANCNRSARNNLHRFGEGTRELRNQRTGIGLPDRGIIKIGQNTEKSHGGLMRFVITQTPVNDLQLTLVRKTLKG